MLSVRGIFEGGAARPSEPIEGRDGQAVIITFLDEAGAQTPAADHTAEWDALTQLIEDCGIETGIGDLAHQHDHYLYGTPKKA